MMHAMHAMGIFNENTVRNHYQGHIEDWYALCSNLRKIDIFMWNHPLWSPQDSVRQKMNPFAPPYVPIRIPDASVLQIQIVTRGNGSALQVAWTVGPSISIHLMQEHNMKSAMADEIENECYVFLENTINNELFKKVQYTALMTMCTVEPDARSILEWNYEAHFSSAFQAYCRRGLAGVNPYNKGITILTVELINKIMQDYMDVSPMCDMNADLKQGIIDYAIYRHAEFRHDFRTNDARVTFIAFAYVLPENGKPIDQCMYHKASITVNNMYQTLRWTLDL
jgi:hypothetical protein